MFVLCVFSSLESMEMISKHLSPPVSVWVGVCAWKASLLRVGVFPDKGAVEEGGEEGEEVCVRVSLFSSLEPMQMISKHLSPPVCVGGCGCVWVCTCLCVRAWKASLLRVGVSDCACVCARY